MKLPYLSFSSKQFSAQHGTINGYNTHKCRCLDCKKAKAAYLIKYKHMDHSNPNNGDSNRALHTLLNWGYDTLLERGDPCVERWRNELANIIAKANS